MTLSDLIAKLFEYSEFTSCNSLANYTEQTQPFTDAFINGTKAAREKEDLLFDALTNDISADEFVSAIELIKTVRRNQIDREQFL